MMPAIDLGAAAGTLEGRDDGAPPAAGKGVHLGGGAPCNAERGTEQASSLCFVSGIVLGGWKLGFKFGLPLMPYCSEQASPLCFEGAIAGRGVGDFRI